MSKSVYKYFAWEYKLLKKKNPSGDVSENIDFFALKICLVIPQNLRKKIKNYQQKWTF